MNEKLTLSLNSESIRKGKRFAKRNRKSVSALVQDYFDSLETTSKQDADEPRINSPLTNQMIKLIRKARTKGRKPIDSRDYREILADELMKKYKIGEKDLSRFKRSH